MKPTNQPPTTGKWVTAGILTMVADITGTLAQFMPMKAVFILAADDIPSFFPSILVSAGPIVTGLALVLAAAVLAVVSKVAKDLALTRSAVSEPFPGARPPGAGTLPNRGFLFQVTVKEFSSFILVVVLLTGSALVSVTFALTILAWIAGSAIVMAVKIHRGSRKPPYPNGRVEFDKGFRKWMQDSALWAAVGAAIFTLVVDFPPLGLTGILLGAVLLRRFQQVVPNLVPLLISQFAGAEAADPRTPAAAKPTQVPFGFLGTRVGQRLLTQSLQEFHLDARNWSVVGRPDNAQITLLTTDTDTGETVACRVFANGQERFLEHELSLRTQLADPTPFHHTAISQETLAGLPSVLIRYDAENSPQLDAKTDTNTAIRWQLGWEMSCVASESLQKDLSDYVVDDPAQFLFPLITTAEALRGPHTNSLRALLPHLDTIRDRYLDGPRVIHFGGALSHQNFLASTKGWREPMNTRQWAVGMFGDRWSDSTNYIKFLGQLADSRDLNPNTVANATLRFHAQRLHRALRRKDLDRITSNSQSLLQVTREEADD